MTLEQLIFIHTQISLSKIGKKSLYVIILIGVFALAVFQDYVFSRLQNTGFYISESLLYNTFWIFFLPFTFLANRLIKRFFPNKKFMGILYGLAIAATFSILHILLFSLSFVFVSHLIFTPPHRFSSILNAALSNQLYIALLFYTIVPNPCRIFLASKEKTGNLIREYPERIKLKIGSVIKKIPISTIQLIATDSPYSVVFTNDQKFLQDRSLKSFESELDPTVFLRVHRSTIINAKFVKELKSRKNGDYDAIMEIGRSVRLSRHFRDNWQILLQ